MSSSTPPANGNHHNNHHPPPPPPPSSSSSYHHHNHRLHHSHSQPPPPPPLHHHQHQNPYHHHHSSSSAKASFKGCCCCLFLLFSFIFLLVLAVILVVVLAVKPKKPQFDLQSVGVQYLGINPNPNPASSTASVSLAIRMLFTAANDNKVEIKYGESRFSVMYRGIPLGRGIVPGFYQPAHSVRQVQTTITVDRVNLAGDLGGFLGNNSGFSPVQPVCFIIRFRPEFLTRDFSIMFQNFAYKPSVPFLSFFL